MRSKKSECQLKKSTRGLDCQQIMLRMPSQGKNQEQEVKGTRGEKQKKGV
jgi:hypothetical protein